ncbi:hypothetical protein D8674_007740 [Pyrus ussuriensis x Pyrus communis]|uniref:Uncharacterized protein n=1 Tax=Pyrus ussuriensis x Pyrus communis TaxID=2448454 RepID=A0A5N5HVH0_9ROSA|nr:hypothetical protein D8674_007740 [Pyrus ussuriensis x Pyrus communis]
MRQLTGIQLNYGCPIISHLFFADDTLIFMRADKQNCDCLLRILDDYCTASGQLVNYQKSCMFFGANVPRSLSVELSHIVGMPLAQDPGKYLGLPSFWGHSKKQGLAFVKGRILEKVQGWKQCTLSQAGKEILIKAVIQAIPAYPMHIFKFPSTLCSDFDALIAEFWWGKNGGEKSIHWVSRGLLGYPKQDGGMGFRNFQDFNDALLAKQCWRLIHDPNSLWAQLLKARYFPHCSFMDATLGGRASWGWSNLLVGREILLRSAHWQIMNGRSTSFVYDNMGISPNHVIMAIMTSVNGFLEATDASVCSPQRNLSLSGPPARWGPPGHPFMKVNVDASWSASSKCGYAGVVIRDHTGKFVAAKQAAGRLSLLYQRLCALGGTFRTVAGIGFRDRPIWRRMCWRREVIRRCAM